MNVAEFVECKTMVERVEQLDAMFSDASGWGSWMVECANERETLMKKLAEHGVMIEHKYQARSSCGGRVD